MTVISEVPPRPKPTPWKIIIPVGIVVVLCCICLVIAGVLAYMGTQGSGPLSMLATATSTPTSTPTRTPPPTSTPTPELSIEGDWDLYYNWDCGSTYSGPATFSFYADGTYYAYEFTGEGYGTWWVQGKGLDFIYDDSPYAHYVGTVNDTGDYVVGSMSTSDGSNGCWYANKR